GTPPPDRSAAEFSVRLDQRQDGKRRRRIGHEQPSPGFAPLFTVFAVDVEGVRPPRRIRALTDLNALLMGLQPLPTLSHSRMIRGKASLPERVHDQPGGIAIRLREQRGNPEARGLARPPRTERLQGPAPIGL